MEKNQVIVSKIFGNENCHGMSAIQYLSFVDTIFKINVFILVPVKEDRDLTCEACFVLLCLLS